MKRTSLLIAILIFSPFLLLAQNTIPYGNNPDAGKYALVNGIKIYYEIYGEGQPLLLIHGNGGSINSFSAQIPGFTKKYKVILADSRCHGKSECKTGDLTYEMMAADLNELLNQLKIDSCLIWGHSDGAILGLIIAFQYPDKVKKLVASGANIQPDSTAIFPELIALEKMYPLIPDTIMRKQIKMMLFHPNISFDKLKQIKAPVLVMAGDRDAIREEHTVKIFQSIPNAQLCIVPGATHFFYAEKPQLFNYFITEFFEKPFLMPSTIKIQQEMAERLLKEFKKN